MSANIKRDGAVVQLDQRAEPDEEVTQDQVTDASRLSRLLMTILRQIALLRRRWAPRRLDFEDVSFTAAGFGPPAIRLTHGFDGAVRWWPVSPTHADWTRVIQSAESNSNTLVLLCDVATTMTIRVEEAG